MCRERVITFKAKSAEQALASLMRQCARAEKSSGDAMRLMARWGVDPQRRGEVLERLIADKFIDDRRFSAAYVREKTDLGGWGERKIAASLKLKGIASDIINEALSVLDRDVLSQRLEQKLERKSRSIKYKDKYDFKGKLIRFGISLGYDYDMVLSVVSQIIIEDEQ